jgi:hypothetical protein
MSSSVHSAVYLSLLACLHLGVPSKVYFLVAYPGVKHITNRFLVKTEHSCWGLGMCIFFLPPTGSLDIIFSCCYHPRVLHGASELALVVCMVELHGHDGVVLSIFGISHERYVYIDEQGRFSSTGCVLAGWLLSVSSLGHTWEEGSYRMTEMN